MISMDRQRPRPPTAVLGWPTALRMTHRDKTAVSSRRFLAFRSRGQCTGSHGSLAFPIAIDILSRAV
jgi:hypothetical protein